MKCGMLRLLTPQLTTSAATDHGRSWGATKGRGHEINGLGSKEMCVCKKP